MEKSTKIIELFIDDLDEMDNGIEYISLVSSPAIERNFLTFNEDKKQKVLADKVKQSIVDYLENNQVGTDRSILKNCHIVSVSKITDGEREHNEYKKKKDQYLKRGKIKGKTDDDSIFDTILGDRKRRVRYYYEGPTDGKNRDFCGYMMRQKKNTLFRWEDIQAMSDGEANDEFGYYDIFKYKGSYNCLSPNSLVETDRGEIRLDEIRLGDKVLTSDDYKEVIHIFHNGVKVVNDYTFMTDKGLWNITGTKDHKIKTTNGWVVLGDLKVGDVLYKVYDDRVMETKIIQVDKSKPYQMDVMDLEVADKHEYVVNDFIVSNCRHFWVKIVYDEMNGVKTNPEVKQPSSEAEKVNIPVIPRQAENDPGLNQIAQEGFGSSCGCGDHQAENMMRENRYCDTFKVSSEDKRILMGPAMIPNETIYRYDPETDDEFYVYFSKETISKLAEKYMRDGKLKNIDMEHNNVRVDAYVIESWIIEGQNDKAYNYYTKDEIPEGSWMVSVKINDEALWKEIKENSFGLKGFSVEGQFLSKYGKQTKDDYLMKKIKDLLEEV